MAEENTNWGQSVGAVVIRDGRVLLGRHTYGPGKGRLILPGGYVQKGETPQQAVAREVMEETRVRVKAGRVVGIRFNMKDWYVLFAAEYLSGTGEPGDEENSEVVWLPIEEALERPDVPDLTKRAIQSAMEHPGLVETPFVSNAAAGSYSYYG